MSNINDEFKSLIGQKVKYHCGSFVSNKNIQGKDARIFAEGVIKSVNYIQMQDLVMCKVHFPEYKKWERWEVKQHMEINLRNLVLESGYQKS